MVFHLLTFVLQEEAELNGNIEEQMRYQQELDSLEERAEDLDKQRSSTISSIRSVERNRKSVTE